MKKVLCLVLLRELPRGGGAFRTWFAAKACKYVFDAFTREGEVLQAKYKGLRWLDESVFSKCFFFGMYTRVVEPWKPNTGKKKTRRLRLKRITTMNGSRIWVYRRAKRHFSTQDQNKP